MTREQYLDLLEETTSEAIDASQNAFFMAGRRRAVQKVLHDFAAKLALGGEAEIDPEKVDDSDVSE